MNFHSQYVLRLIQAGKINLFSGNGTGFLDGDAAAAKFNHPRSFAVDSKGNVYVADKNNHAIRKISRSSVTTIAGGYANKGHTDGPAQNATFSNDFYLSFFPKICALIITDRGSNLVRLMHLKPEDCAHGSRVVSWPWVTLIGFICLLLGSVAGFVGRPFLTSLEDISSCSDSRKATLKHCWSNPGQGTVMVCSGIISAIANSAPVLLLVQLGKLSLSLIHLVFCHHWNCIVGIRRQHVASCSLSPHSTHSVGRRVRRQYMTQNPTVGLAVALGKQ